MKKVTVCTLIGLTSLILLSCGTTESVSSEKKQESVTSPVVKEPVKTQEELYAETLAKININQISTPKETLKGTAFKAPFVAQITDAENKPLSGYEVIVSIPVSKTDGIVQFEKKSFISSEDGMITIESDTPKFSCNTFVSILPAVPEGLNKEDKTLSDAIESKTLNLSYKVKSDVINKGTVLFVYDFNEKNNPTQNSSTILSEIKKRGVWRIGNAPVSDKSYIGKPLKNLYEANYEIIEDEFGYLLYGTVKFETPVTEVEDGYSCTLKVDLVGIEMKKGTQVFSTSVTHSAVGANWNKCVSKCKDEIAVKVVDELIYGL